MGEALARGISKTQMFRTILVTDVLKERLEAASKQGFRAVSNNALAAEEANVVLIAVKPHDVGVVLKEIRDGFTQEKLLISIAAGVPISFIQKFLSEGKIVRVMPNLAVAVREAATALSYNSLVKQKERELAFRIFKSVGEVVEVEESQLNVITALSGSGPGYMFQIIKALSEGAAKEGLPWELALRFSAHAAIGAGRMMLETGKSPDELTKMVATPGGTTEAGLSEMSKGAVAATLVQVVASATKKAAEITERIMKS